FVAQLDFPRRRIDRAPRDGERWMELVVGVIRHQALENLPGRAVVGTAARKQRIERRLLGCTPDHEIAGGCDRRQEEKRCEKRTHDQLSGCNDFTGTSGSTT